ESTDLRTTIENLSLIERISSGVDPATCTNSENEPSRISERMIQRNGSVETGESISFTYCLHRATSKPRIHASFGDNVVVAICAFNFELETCKAVVPLKNVVRQCFGIIKHIPILP